MSRVEGECYSTVREGRGRVLGVSMESCSEAEEAGDNEKIHEAMGQGRSYEKRE